MPLNAASHLEPFVRVQRKNCSVPTMPSLFSPMR